MGVKHVYFTGYTPYPLTPNDDRLPHISRKLSQQVAKTALGADKLVPWSHSADIRKLLTKLQKDGHAIIGLEQAPNSISLPEWTPPDKIAILLGREVDGIEENLLTMCDSIVEIPQFGVKESLNVVQAAAVMLYHVRFAPFA
jgi:tRNA G18 (ribose-2'-O)-methylase SpoU